MKYALLALVLLCGCATNPMDTLIREHQAAEAAGQETMKFEVGDLVAIKLGGLGMVVDRSGFRGTYLIRTGPAGQYARRWFDEFELEMP